MDHIYGRKDWTLNTSCVIYEKNLHEDAMSRGLQRVNPIPHCGERQVNEPNIELWRKPL